MNIPCRLHSSPEAGKYSRSLSLIILFLAFFAFNAFSQNTLFIKGRVLNEKGDPVSGASITVKGTTTGASTNGNGDFEISASQKNILVITSLGYSSKQVPINGESFLNITLQQSATGLNEVVVIGYGTQRKEAITGSVSSISGEKLSQVPSSNIRMPCKDVFPVCRYPRHQPNQGPRCKSSYAGSVQYRQVMLR